MKKKLILVSVVFVLLTLVIFSGCSNSPKGNPDDAINAYFEGLKNMNHQQSYDVLSEYNKKTIDKDSFFLMHELEDEYRKFKEVKITKKNMVKDYSINGEVYTAVQYDVTETIIQYDDDNKEHADTYNSVVIYEDGLWKFCVNDYDVKTMISDRYLEVGWMYVTGNGKSKNSNEAAINAKKAIEYNSLNTDAYYLLGYTYIDLNRYEDALKAATEGMKVADNNESKSNLAVVMGLASEYLGNYEYAKAFYTEAINFDPNNEYAQTNLNNLQ